MSDAAVPVNDRRAQMFPKLSDAQIARLAKHAKRRKVAAGEVIFERNESVVRAPFAAVTPSPAVGLPEARSGGQFVAQAPLHMLCVPVSFSNR